MYEEKVFNNSNLLINTTSESYITKNNIYIDIPEPFDEKNHKFSIRNNILGIGVCIITFFNTPYSNHINCLNNTYNNSFNYAIINDIGIVNNMNEYTNTKINNKDEIIMSRDITPDIQLNLDKLKMISQLDFNWNLYGAEPINTNLIDIMRNLIYELEYQPQIFPTACNSIQFEYDNPKGDYLEFELINDDEIKIFKLDSNDNETYSSCKPDSKVINKILGEFYGTEYKRYI